MLARIALLLFTSQPVWTVSAASASPAKDDLSIKLSKHVSNYNLGVFNIVEALIRVSNDFQIPMGIAWVNTPAARSELPLVGRTVRSRRSLKPLQGRSQAIRSR